MTVLKSIRRTAKNCEMNVRVNHYHRIEQYLKQETGRVNIREICEFKDREVR